MWKRVMLLLFLYQLCRFQDKNLWYTFQALVARKRGLATSTFYMKMNLFNIAFHMT